MKNGLKLLSVLTAMICSLFLFSYNVSSSYAAEDVNSQTTFSYLYDQANKTYYQSNIVAGSASGYGDFEVGTSNTIITADANTGFELVGFKVLFLDIDKEIFIDNQNLTDNAKIINADYIENSENFNTETKQTLKSLFGTCSITVEFSFVGESQLETDNYFSSASLTFDRVFANAQVNPVYDYIYYNTQITSEDFNIFKFNSTQIELDANNKIYYQTKNETTIEKAVLKSNDKYFYFDTIYYDQGEGTDFYYTLHAKNDNTTDNVKVDILRGANRLDDVVNFSFDIDTIEYNEQKTSEDYLQKQNLDMLSFNIDTTEVACRQADSFIEAETDFIKTVDQLNRTTNIKGKFKITQTQTIAFNYDVYFVTKLQIKLDNNIVSAQDKLISTDSEGSLLNFLVKTGNVETSNYVAEIEKYSYFVKTQTTSIKVDCPEIIYNYVDGYEFAYFKLNSINGESVTSKIFKIDNNDTVIVVDLSSINYQINFELRLKNKYNKIISMQEEYEFDKKLKNRGESLIFNNAVAPNFVGYNFVGYLNKSQEESYNLGADIEITESYSYTIDETKPESTTILLIYEYIDYTIEFYDYNQMFLVDPETVSAENPTGDKIYPINSVKLNMGETNLTEISGGLNDENNAFSYNVNLGQTLSVLPTFNDGFELNKFKIKAVNGTDKIVENSGNNSLTFEITKDFISNYIDSENKILIQILEDYTLYSFTFYTTAREDFNLGSNVIMADITLTRNGEVSTSTENEIVINDLKKYEVLLLSSIGKTATHNDEEYTYIFQNFIEDGEAFNINDYTQTETDISGVTKLVTFTQFKITKDAKVKVVYQMPTTTINIAVADGDTNAFTINNTNIVILQNGETIDMDEFNSAIVLPGDVTVEIKNINFGYKLNSITLNGSSVNAEQQGQIYTLNLTLNANNIQRLVLDFIPIEYRLYINQKYSENDTAKNYVIFGSENYKVLNIEQQIFSFDMPEGYYVGATSNNFTDSKMAQTNDYLDDSYNYTMQEGEFAYLINNQSEDVIEGEGETAITYKKIELDFIYYIHTYKVKVNYTLTEKQEYKNQIIWPDINVIYTFNYIEYDITDDNTEINEVDDYITFKNIPYGAQVKLSVAQLENGLHCSGWDNITTEITSNSSLTLISITEDKEYNLKLSFKAYEIIKECNTNYGNIDVKVNDEISERLSLFDKVEITINPKSSKGYKFKNLYLEYTYDEATWNTLEHDKYYKNLFIYDQANKSFSQNTNENYDNSVVYVYLVETIENSFTIEKFIPENYTLKDNKFKIFAEFTTREITINNKTIADFKIVIGKDDQGNSITADSSTFATYTVYKNGQAVDNNALFTIGDKVEIKITLNSIELDDVTYNYKDGLSLNRIVLKDLQQILKGYNNDDYVNNCYTYQFAIIDIISKVPATDILNLDYYYIASTKTITMSTNISYPSFYKKDGTINFNMGYDETRYGYGAAVSNSNGDSLLKHSKSYLSKIWFGYQFYGSYKDNFYIDGILINGEVLTTTEMADKGVNILKNNENKITGISVRYIENLNINWIVKPIVEIKADEIINNNYYFYSTYNCIATGSNPTTITSVVQYLSVGEQNANIICADELGLTLTYSYNNIEYYDGVSDAHTYEVDVKFDSETYDWLKELDWDYNIYFTITQRDIYLTFNNSDKVISKKTYDGTSDLNDIFDYTKNIIITDNAGLNIKYFNCIGNFNLIYNNTAKITTTLNGEEVNVVDCGSGYNLVINNFSLFNDDFNNNFNLRSTSLTIKNCVEITPKTIYIEGLEIYDKVYDGTNKVIIKNKDNIYLSGVLAGDDITFDLENLNLWFEDFSISTTKKDKKLSIDSSAFLNQDKVKAKNYIIDSSSINIKATIYPDKISSIDGKITVYNLRGLQNPDLADLIPLNATLEYSTILSGTNEYENMYGRLEQYFINGKEFAIGYTVQLYENGIKQNLSNNLHLQLPKAKRYLSTLYLTEEYTGEIATESDEEFILLDLNSVNLSLNTFILLRQKELFKLWQVILIVAGAVVVIVGVVVAFVIIRKKRKAEDYKLDKI